jgi:hypothetical protein
MTDMKDPVRLSLGGSPDDQSLLRAASSNLPTRRQLDHLASRLAPVVTAAPAASSLLPWVVAGVVVLGAAGAVLLGRDRASSPPVASTAPVEIRSEPPPAPVPIAVTPTMIVEEPKPAPARPLVKKKHKEPKPEVAVPAPTQKPREMDLLGPAHEAVAKREHARALELVARHMELYPSGALTEEREAVAIEALWRLGRDEARTRFDQFVVKYPRSGYRRRLERLLEEASR